MSIEVGGVVEGTVTGITKFGAFVELEGKKTGLIHISEVADVYVNDVNDFLKVGQKVNVKVLTVDDRGKIGLSIKKAQPKAPAGQGAGQGPAPRQARPQMANRPQGGTDFHRGGQPRFTAGPLSFEDKLSRFLKDSDERLTDLKRKTDSKRGGRGARRSG